MPLKRLRTPTGFRKLTGDLRADLECGPGNGILDYLPSYERPNALGMHAAWLLHGRDTLTEWLAEPRHVGTRPWSWWVWGAPEAARWPYGDRPWQHDDEIAVLRGIGLITPEEEARLEADHADRAARGVLGTYGCACRGCDKRLVITGTPA